MRTLVALTLVLCFSGSAKADLIQAFGTTNSGAGIVVGSTFTLVLPGLVADGVAFDATLNATASDSLGLAASGIGPISNGESLTFSMTVSNEVGGTVAFNGFVANDFNNFGSNAGGVLSLDSSLGTTDDNFFVTTAGGDLIDISSTSPISYSAIAESGNSNSFRIESVSGAFSGTAVPEPSSLLMVGFGAAIAVHRRRATR